jgi:uncharacterized protein
LIRFRKGSAVVKHMLRLHLALGTCLTALAIARLAAGQVDHLIQLDPPGQREFILDKAALITPGDEQDIRQLADKLLTDKGAPLVVVTINSMADHGGGGMRIETFARLLFDQWQIGPARVNDQTWNRGILLLVSKNDRRARIELGAGWGREKDALCQQIMDEQIIPQFKQGEFSAGITAGATALAQMARGLALPRPPTPWWYWPVILGVAAVVIVTVVSLVRNGSQGWAWLFWAGLFGLLGAGLYYWMTHMPESSSDWSDGGFSGGSFGGGGFSGGGGASGSW